MSKLKDLHGWCYSCLIGFSLVLIACDWVMPWLSLFQIVDSFMGETCHWSCHTYLQGLSKYFSSKSWSKARECLKMNHEKSTQTLLTLSTTFTVPSPLFCWRWRSFFLLQPFPPPGPPHHITRVTMLLHGWVLNWMNWQFAKFVDLIGELRW